MRYWICLTKWFMSYLAWASASLPSKSSKSKYKTQKSELKKQFMSSCKLRYHQSIDLLLIFRCCLQFHFNSVTIADSRPIRIPSLPLDVITIHYFLISSAGYLPTWGIIIKSKWSLLSLMKVSDHCSDYTITINLYLLVLRCMLYKYRYSQK